MVICLSACMAVRINRDVSSVGCVRRIVVSFLYCGRSSRCLLVARKRCKAWQSCFCARSLLAAAMTKLLISRSKSTRSENICAKVRLCMMLFCFSCPSKTIAGVPLSSIQVRTPRTPKRRWMVSLLCCANCHAVVICNCSKSGLLRLPNPHTSLAGSISKALCRFSIGMIQIPS